MPAGMVVIFGQNMSWNDEGLKNMKMPLGNAMVSTSFNHQMLDAVEVLIIIKAKRLHPYKVRPEAIAYTGVTLNMFLPVIASP